MNAINFKRTVLAAIMGSSMAFGLVVSSNADARQPRDQQSGEDRPARGKQDEDAKAAQKREREVQKEVRAEQARTQTQQRQYREEQPRPSQERAKPRDHDRLPEPRRQALIAEQRQQAAQFSRQAESRRADLERYGRNLQRQHRDSQYRYQQDYYDRMRRHHSRHDYRTYNYYNDPYFYTAPRYRYYRGGSYFSINIYGANLLQQAINFGYSEGLRAGRADRLDGWRFDYRGSYAYRDANYGYYGFYVSQAEYNYYFRRGFERGYEDGYYGRRRYGHYYNGADVMLAPAMSMIFNFHLH